MQNLRQPWTLTVTQHLNPWLRSSGAGDLTALSIRAFGMQRQSASPRSILTVRPGPSRAATSAITGMGRASISSVTPDLGPSSASLNRPPVNLDRRSWL